MLMSVALSSIFNGAVIDTACDARSSFTLTLPPVVFSSIIVGSIVIFCSVLVVIVIDCSRSSNSISWPTPPAFPVLITRLIRKSVGSDMGGRS